MADHFGIPQLVDYLSQMELKLAHVDHEQEMIELAFHGHQGQWRLIVGIQQKGDVRKLMLIAPHIGTVTAKKRLECLEALMAVNYRIAMGKFGLDLDDGEVRLEEALPLANDAITFGQFQLVFSALTQTIAMYHSLIPRIVYGNLSVRDALEACEQEFAADLESMDTLSQATMSSTQTVVESHDELDVQDVLAEVTRIFEEPKE
jgi:hypothetical protein